MNVPGGPGRKRKGNEMETNRLTLERMTELHPNLAEHMRLRGWVANVVCVCRDTMTVCHWHETADGKRVMASGSKALFDRAGSVAK